MENILVVEDNSIISNSIKYFLELDDKKVKIAEDEIYAKLEFDKFHFDLIILDICLPVGNGIELFKYFKKIKDIPIIFLTALGDENDVVNGLDIGADDYITKPFRSRELVSRVNNVLRRYNKKHSTDEIIKVHNVEYNANKNILYKNGKELNLTALEIKIVSMLFLNKGNILTREQILEKIWDIAGNFVNDNTLTVYIKRIREKIEDDVANPKIIKTVRGIGYKIGD